MMYIAIDGDNIGSHLERLILENDEEQIFEFSHMMKKLMDSIEDFMIMKGMQIILKGGDNILCKGKIEIADINIAIEPSSICSLKDSVDKITRCYPSLLSPYYQHFPYSLFYLSLSKVFHLLTLKRIFSSLQKHDVFLRQPYRNPDV